MIPLTIILVAVPIIALILAFILRAVFAKKQNSGSNMNKKNYFGKTSIDCTDAIDPLTGKQTDQKIDKNKTDNPEGFDL